MVTCKNKKVITNGIGQYIKSIYPKILSSSRVRGMFLINKPYFNAINKTNVVSCLKKSKKS